MEQKLTAQILCAYLGAPIKLHHDAYDTNENDEVKQLDASTIYWLITDNTPYTGDLLLKPLPSLSDEDAIEIAKLVWSRYYEIKDITEPSINSKSFYHIEVVGETESKIHRISIELYDMNIREYGFDKFPFPHYVVDYLRNNGYDCDNLIQSGIAIKKQ